MRDILPVAVVFCLGCETSTSPVQPTPPSPSPTPPIAVEFSVRGIVEDTAFRRLSGATVEVVDGPRAGTRATTDERGGFSFSGTFTGAITVSVSSDGHRTARRMVDGRQGLSCQGPSCFLGFELESVTPSQDITGTYTLTISADAACTNLPGEARTRIYTATISRSTFKRTLFWVDLRSDTTLAEQSRIAAGVAGDFVAFNVTDLPNGDGPGIGEKLTPTTYLAVTGSAGTSFALPTLVAPFDGWIEYCPTEFNGSRRDFYYYNCPAPVTCRSSAHRLVLTRR